MNLKQNINIPLDKFINLSLYDKKFGYYMKKNPFGKKGDFITAPNISRLFPEMIAIWIISFWKDLGSPKNFNLIELGAGNGEMIKIFIESFRRFEEFNNSCKIFIYEKSPTLIKIQKKKLKGNKVFWLSNLKKIKKFPSVFVANEFFDSLAIKQFIKLDTSWFERYVSFKKNKKPFFFDKKIDMKKFEKKIKYKVTLNQKFIEYSEAGVNYLRSIIKIIKKNQGGILIIDYGYLDKKMKNTLQAISNHEYSNVLNNIGNSDITHNINFHLLKKIVSKSGGLRSSITNQRNFLISLGIKKRAEILSKNITFLKKADIFYRMERLISEKQMGTLFKVMFVQNKEKKFNLGF